MSTGRPPAPEVASTSSSAPSSAPSTRRTGAITPVEVSLCAQAYTSTPGSARGRGRVPVADSITVGSARNGALRAAVANFEENSPKDRCWLRSRIRPNVATSQNAVAPPLPSTTSYPSGRLKRLEIPSRTRPTRFLTGACRWDVPSREVPVAASACSASGRTLDGPEPKRPSRGLRCSGIVRVSAGLLVPGLLMFGVPTSWVRRSVGLTPLSALVRPILSPAFSHPTPHPPRDRPGTRTHRGQHAAGASLGGARPLGPAAGPGPVLRPRREGAGRRGAGRVQNSVRNAGRDAARGGDLRPSAGRVLRRLRRGRPGGDGWVAAAWRRTPVGPGDGRGGQAHVRRAGGPQTGLRPRRPAAPRGDGAAGRGGRDGPGDGDGPAGRDRDVRVLGL